ncbi:hypothetical protein H5V45_01505 [Nocardioides sp. KIGAM211]|uniref:N-acetyltransferase n=1 Tax=Nocardioides luti TaxID=2761101 RepID=A0A7X0RFD0_9ACTN|nr:hypothetical protein [Nocardioides luti]MBB6625984.1 hypothetical protein [Nocardioides luti]
MTRGGGVRRLTAADLDWVTLLASHRRESLVPHAPRFWAPAAEAKARHRDFLGHLIDSPDVVAVRTDHAFLIALSRGGTWLVDDAAAGEADGDLWATEGVDLLRHALHLGGCLRFVVPVFETARMAAAEQVGLVPVELWWHRDLDRAEAAPAAEDVDLAVRVPGAAGRLVAAPPVYDPGGPVLLVTEVESPDALTRIESAAAARGAGVSVVSQDPGDETLRGMLGAAGYVLTTAFCERP